MRINASFQSYFQTYDMSRRHRSSRSLGLNGLSECAQLLRIYACMIRRVANLFMCVTLGGLSMPVSLACV